MRCGDDENEEMGHSDDKKALTDQILNNSTDKRDGRGTTAFRGNNIQKPSGKTNLIPKPA